MQILGAVHLSAGALPTELFISSPMLAVSLFCHTNIFYFQSSQISGEYEYIKHNTQKKTRIFKIGAGMHKFLET